MDEKKCQNCKYFILHYTNLSGLYRPMPYGHCVSGKLSINRTKLIYCENVCEFWESNQEKIQQKHDSIEKAICRMADDLNHFIQTLNEQKRL